MWICAPSGVEFTVSCPGTIAGAGAGVFPELFFLGLYFDLMETFGAVSTGVASAMTGSGAGCVAGAGWGTLAGAVAGVDAVGVLSSSTSSLRMWKAIPTMTRRMTPTAPAIEYMKSLGGVFLISLTAFLATTRGCTFGFSGCGGGATWTVDCGSSTGGSGGGGGAT